MEYRAYSTTTAAMYRHKASLEYLTLIWEFDWLIYWELRKLISADGHAMLPATAAASKAYQLPLATPHARHAAAISFDICGWQ